MVLQAQMPGPIEGELTFGLPFLAKLRKIIRISVYQKNIVKRINPAFIFPGSKIFTFDKCKGIIVRIFEGMTRTAVREVFFHLAPAIYVVFLEPPIIRVSKLLNKATIAFGGVVISWFNRGSIQSVCHNTVFPRKKPKAELAAKGLEMKVLQQNYSNIYL